ncbi:MAG: hypothetical protein HPZ88_07060 [Duodenibacillus sp.]|nr:hypothetical protein [Duodenibacillus sp.]
MHLETAAAKGAQPKKLMPKQTARPKRPAAARLKSGFCMSRGTVRHRAQPLRTAHREKALNAENRPQTQRFFEVSALYEGIAALYRKILKKARPCCTNTQPARQTAQSLSF